jgi:hypothetical protein
VSALSRAALVVGAVLVAAGVAGAVDVGRYRFSCRADSGTFVLDTETGRVWRYDRVDDAWYLYDLEALVEKGKPGKRREEPPEAPHRPAESP